jgi:hypothetical protein
LDFTTGSKKFLNNIAAVSAKGKTSGGETIWFMRIIINDLVK